MGFVCFFYLINDWLVISIIYGIVFNFIYFFVNLLLCIDVVERCNFFYDSGYFDEFKFIFIFVYFCFCGMSIIIVFLIMKCVDILFFYIRKWK